ncbi:nucleoside hydrolase (plasmid) [Rhizobium bangladeshense]|uniref:nucleoside hydrolase n=1 Tax=Rhizobium bangladeshense TaxID=1138189 RepID=UPI001A986052|nr:nucleoside hydrolase [Rhizobium bangladeshense]QSY97846.1 nucleoside hydrolase [Rhizobium bangladeshense]
MNSHRMRSFSSSLATALVMGMCLSTVSNAQTVPNKFILDQDFAGPGGSDLQPILFFLHNPEVELLGLTGVTGDEWMPKGIAQALRFLEIAEHPQIPVYKGALMPLINTPARMTAWEAQYGKLSWKGAWNKPETDATQPGFDPMKVPDLQEGMPTAKAQTQSAVDFMIEQVHKFPGQVTIVAGGPLTNIALAVRTDPQFAPLVKTLLVTGAPKAAFDPVSGKVMSADAFNSIFDPEAAHIVMTAGFPSIVATGLVTDAVSVDEVLIGEMKAKSSALTDYLVKNAWKDLPMWDEITTAIAIDSTLATKTTEVLADVDIGEGRQRGQFIVFDEKSAPAKVAKITVVLDIDRPRFRKMFLEAVAR